MGYSAGGISVTAHLLSPMSKGLFHRAIAMSDTIFAQWPIEHHQMYLAQKQARLEFGIDPLLLWTPVIELDFGQERFLTEHPIVSGLNGKFANVPIMAGVTSEEFSHLGPRLMRNPEMVKEINDDFERIAPISFLYERNTPKSKYISGELRKHFLGNGPIDNSTVEGLKHLYADGTVGFGVNRGIKLLAAKNTENCYYYRFSYQGRYSHVYLPGTKIPYGPVHHDDLIYLFYASPLFPKFKVTDPEYKMVLKLTTLVANFALTGKPTPTATQELDNADWTPFTNKNNKYMDIGKTLKMQDNLYEDRYSVWDKLFPLSDYEK
ncbi:hypothetical protein FQR65_LT18959 [Abscondita terminalis]|nr:hypothetical protein FQR65_LT18959 [Abscondita terminalis]